MIKEEKNNVKDVILENMLNENEKDIAEMIDKTEDVVFEEVNEEGEVDTKDVIKKLRAKIKVLEKEKQEYLSGWQRAQADYINFKKETEVRRKEEARFGSKNLVREILPVLDAYDLARVNKEVWEKVDQNWRVGVEYIFGQLIGVLEREGAMQYGKAGEIFDPELHESIEVVETKEKESDGKISQVLQSGYKMGENILRVARVKVYELKE